MIRRGGVFLPRFAWVSTFFFVFVQRVVAQVGIKNKRKMSDCDSESIYSESERSCDSDSEGSLADFVVDEDEELVEACTCRAEVCASNIINRKRRHESSSYEEAATPKRVTVTPAVIMYPAKGTVLPPTDPIAPTPGLTPTTANVLRLSSLIFCENCEILQQIVAEYPWVPLSRSE